MLKIWKREKANKLPWSKPAQEGLEQAMQQTPVPAMLKMTVRKQLESAAEEAARAAGHNEVTAEDLMQGLLSKLPASMREKVEQAAKLGPDGLKKLQEKLGKKG